MTSDFTTNKTQYEIDEMIFLSFPAPLPAAHTLRYRVGDIIGRENIAAGQTEHSFYANNILLSSSAMVESATAPMTLTLFCQDGGEITKTVTLFCPPDRGPTVSGASAAALSDSVPGSWGVYVAGKSKARITLDTPAAPLRMSPVVSYAISGCGAAAESDSVPIAAETDFLAPGENVVIVSATDKRGGTGQQRVVLNALAYAPPALSGLLTVRCLADGTESDEGAWFRAQGDLIYSSCGGHNAASCEVFWRLQGDTVWQSAGSLNGGQIIFGGGFSLAHNYEIRYAVTDLLGTQTFYYDAVTRAVWEMHVKRGGGAWAFGGVADRMGALKIYGDLEVSGIIRAGSLFSYDAASNTLTITPREGTFSFDSATGTLSIADP